MNVLGQAVGILEPENRKAGQGIFYLSCEGQGHTCHSLTKTIPSCMTVHNNAAVSVMFSEMLISENFPFNVYQCHKSSQR